MDARRKFGEHERGVRVARGVDESNFSFLITVIVMTTSTRTVGFVHMYEHCYLVTRDVFYVTFHREYESCVVKPVWMQSEKLG